MRKVIYIILLLMIVILMPSNVRAAIDENHGCEVTDCSEIIDEGEPTQRVIKKWCNGDCGGIDNGGGPPNYHVMPDGTCRKNGETGSTGQSGPGCIDRSVNCAVGSTIAPHMPLYSDCRMQFGGQYCGEPGTAQLTTGCCDPLSGGVCVSNPEYTTYTCCPGGTVETRHEGETYSSTKSSCWDTTTCSNPYDVYLGYTRPASSGVCAIGCSEYNENTGNCRVGMSYNIYYPVVTCRAVTYSCDSVCTATAPTDITITRGASGTTANVSWTPGKNTKYPRYCTCYTQCNFSNPAVL